VTVNLASRPTTLVGPTSRLNDEAYARWVLKTVQSSPPGRTHATGCGEQLERCTGMHGGAEMEGRVAQDKIDTGVRHRGHRVVADSRDLCSHPVGG